jgi:hypothetical protein
MVVETPGVQFSDLYVITQDIAMFSNTISSKYPESVFSTASVGVGAGNTLNTTEIVQQSSHSLQLPPYKPLRKKLVNVDTRYQKTNFSSALGSATPASYDIVLPQRITDVQSIRCKSAEIPLCFYNFSAAIHNTYFTIFNVAGGLIHSTLIPDGQYTCASLATAIHTDLSNASINVDISFVPVPGSSLEGSMHFVNSNTNPVVVSFAVDPSGNLDKTDFKSKLGWALGFRKANYTVPANGGIVTGEALADINTIRYLFIVLRESPNQGNPGSFVCPKYDSYLDRDILARVSMVFPQIPFGSVLSANHFNGLLASDVREYSPGKLALQNLHVEILNEWGVKIPLGGKDFSMLLELEYY